MQQSALVHSPESYQSSYMRHYRTSALALYFAFGLILRVIHRFIQLTYNNESFEFSPCKY